MIVYGLFERKEKANACRRISVIDNIWWTKSAVDRQTDRQRVGLSCRQRVGSKIMGGGRLANGPPRASNIGWKIYIPAAAAAAAAAADISKYNSEQGFAASKRL